MMDDKRPIQGLFFDDAQGTQLVVGSDGVTKIEVYGENGEMALVPWFSVYRGEVISVRVNAARIGSVAY